jgi:hypothetical protein
VERRTCAAGSRWQGRQRRGRRRQRRRQRGGRRRRRLGRHGLPRGGDAHIEGAITATGGLGVGGTTTITTEVRTGNSATTGGRGLSAASASTILRRRHPRRHRHTAGRLHRFNLSERRGRPRQLNGQYTHGTHEYARTDGSMVIRRGDRRQGDYGWNFCRASDGVVLEPCDHQSSRQGEVSDVRNRPAASKRINRWGGATGHSKISYGCV